MGRQPRTINEIVNGKTAITPDTAIQLELTLGISASFWNNLEAAYRENVARDRSEDAALRRVGSWAKAFYQIKDLVRHKLIEHGTANTRSVEALLRLLPSQ